MSIIGTRPPLISETSLYELHHRARLAIKPGITGMWQVSGRSDITDFEEVVRLDKEYITNWNIGLDIKILFKTVMAGIKVLLHSSQSLTMRWDGMVSAGYRTSFIPRPSAFMTSIISWHRMRIRTLSLKTGVTS